MEINRVGFDSIIYSQKHAQSNYDLLKVQNIKEEKVRKAARLVDTVQKGGIDFGENKIRDMFASNKTIQYNKKIGVARAWQGKKNPYDWFQDLKGNGIDLIA